MIRVTFLLLPHLPFFFSLSVPLPTGGSIAGYESTKKEIAAVLVKVVREANTPAAYTVFFMPIKSFKVRRGKSDGAFACDANAWLPTADLTFAKAILPATFDFKNANANNAKVATSPVSTSPAAVGLWKQLKNAAFAKADELDVVYPKPSADGKIKLLAKAALTKVMTPAKAALTKVKNIIKK